MKNSTPSEPQKDAISHFGFNKSNYRLLYIGLALNVVGFILMIGGGAESHRSISSIRRQSPVGNQEANDWLVALESVADRIDSLERYSRMHGQTITHLNESQTAAQTRLDAVCRDIDAYKSHITSVHTNMELVLNQRLGRLDGQCNALFPITERIELRVNGF